MKLFTHPGEKPTRSSLFPNERFITDKQAEELATAEQLWGEQMLRWGFQQMRLDKAINREELRQDNINKYKLDPKKATLALHAKKAKRI